MQKYSKIQTLFKRCTEKGPDKNKLIDGDWTLPEFEVLKDVLWEATEKIDGTNISVIWDGKKIEYAGRDESAQIPARLVNHLIGVFPPDVFEVLELPPMIIFGEGYGAGIQKVGNDYMPDGVAFSPFDVYCGDFWLRRDSVEDIASKLGLTPVPLLEPHTLEQAIDQVRTGFPSQLIGAKAKAEGIVLRAPEGILTRAGERIICKVKTRDFAKGTVQRRAE